MLYPNACPLITNTESPQKLRVFLLGPTGIILVRQQFVLF